MNRELVFVTTKKDIIFMKMSKILSQFDIKWFDTKDELFKYFLTSISKPILISYNHNIIFPKWLLDKVIVGYNIHSAPPEYPGRDPHHFAIYDQVSEYGSTVHIIDEKVDNGPIILNSKFDCSNIYSPIQLLDITNVHSLLLIEKLLSMILNNEEIKPIKLNWGTRRTTRKMFLEYCRINTAISKEELEKRIRAFSVKGYNNITLQLHGYVFRLDEDNLSVK